MTVKQAAERLEVSASLIYALIGEGKLPCTRHGLGRGCIRISEDQLAKYIEGAARGTPSCPASGGWQP